jgi:glutaredoxin-related protein
METVGELWERMMVPNNHVVCGRTSCPYTEKARGASPGDATYVELNQFDGLRTYLRKRFDHPTVPICFIHGEFVGGCTEYVARLRMDACTHAIARSQYALDGIAKKKNKHGRREHVHVHPQQKTERPKLEQLDLVLGPDAYLWKRKKKC